MRIIIRKPNLKPEINGIPKDFLDTQTYFNKALKDNSLFWIPRKTPIKDSEIKKLWIPTLETNITLVAELEGEVVGQVTVFYDTESTGYEHAKQRVIGNIGFTARPDVYKQVINPLISGLVDELKKQNKTVIWTIAYESPGNKIMEKLGYSSRTLKNQERYKKAGLCGKVCEYQLP